MSYAIVGFGAVGQALARAFARTNIDVARQLGFAPINLRKLAEGGALVQARGRTWTQLIFQDLFKKEQ